jgi:hypothetical protein
MNTDPNVFVFDGHHVKGCGNAHKYNDQHTRFFNRKMVSTFNVRINRPFDDYDLYPAKKAKVDGCLKWYHLVQIENATDHALGWSFHWEGSALGRSRTLLEIVTKKPIPESLQHGPLKVTVFRRWGAKERDAWAKDQYWFQTFPWSPKRKADSGFVWDVIAPHAKWSNQTVLDIGTHYGYHAIRASELGADVVGFEPDETSFPNALIIDRHIEQQGVEYWMQDPGGVYNIILYLSVHHQIDPTYDGLYQKLQGLCSRCGKLFVELILPSSYSEFGRGMSDPDLDKLVGGDVLATYEHRVRAHRRIYQLEGHLT